MPIQFRAVIWSEVPAGCEKIFTGIDKRLGEFSPFCRWLTHITTTINNEGKYVLTFSLPQKPTKEQRDEMQIIMCSLMQELLNSIDVAIEHYENGDSHSSMMVVFHGID